MQTITRRVSTVRSLELPSDSEHQCLQCCHSWDMYNKVEDLLPVRAQAALLMWHSMKQEDKPVAQEVSINSGNPHWPLSRLPHDSLGVSSDCNQQVQVPFPTKQPVTLLLQLQATRHSNDISTLTAFHSSAAWEVADCGRATVLLLHLFQELGVDQAFCLHLLLQPVTSEELFHGARRASRQN